MKNHLKKSCLVCVLLIVFWGGINTSCKKGTETFPSTNLPVICIETSQGKGINSKDDWSENAHIIVYDENRVIKYSSDQLMIKGRGNFTWLPYIPKKSYTIKLPQKYSLLDMPEHKRWVLLANFHDRTLLRNDVAFYIAQLTDLAYTPQGRFIELVLNGKHLGNYYLCEQIRIGKNRVDIEKMTSDDISGDNIQGGYLVEVDIIPKKKFSFQSSTKQLPFQFRSPDEETIQKEQIEWFSNYVNEFESKLYAPRWLEKREYMNYIDVNSFVDYWFVYELTMNYEPNSPKSCFMFKDRNGKLTMGPVWDFDYGTYNPNSSNRFTIIKSLYYERLFQDPEFVNIVKNRWNEKKIVFKTVPQYIKQMSSKIESSNAINLKLWPIRRTKFKGLFSEKLSINKDEELSFDDAVNRMIEAYVEKYKWLDTQIKSFSNND